MVSPIIGSPQTYTVVDMATYLDRALHDKGESGIAEAKKLNHWWQERTANMEEVELYDDDDIHEVLQKVYPVKQVEEESSVWKDGDVHDSIARS